MEDDGDDKDDTKRRTRNLSEKKRRDQFNMLVQELSTMVSTNSRKMDKSTVLKSTISFLKIHNEITVRSRAHDVHEEWKPAFLSNEEFTYLILEALEGFVMVFSSTGRICYVSESIASILGHSPMKVVNKSIFDFTCEDDRPILYNLLQRNVAATEQVKSASKDKEMVTFELHLKRDTINYCDETHELIRFNGHFRANFERKGGEHDKYPQDIDSSVLFVGTGRLCTPQLIRDELLLDPSRGEFTSRHSLEWKFLFLDHRAPPIIGYLPFEVLGTSGYDYYHFDDLEKVVACHEELMQKGEVTSCYYRFLTKGQQWIWLQTRYYITYHQWHSKPEFVVCTHRVISYAEVVKSTKQEGDESELSEAEIGNAIKEAPSEEATTSNMSPTTYTSETSDAFCSSYRTQSPDVPPNRRVSKSTAGRLSAMAPLSPSYMSEQSEPYGSSYHSHSQRPAKRQKNNDDGIIPMSPSYMSEASETYQTYRSNSQTASVRSSGTAPCKRGHRYGSDTCSVSGDSHSTGRRSNRECKMVMVPQGHKVAPQHAIGAQYLEPVPYVGMGVPGVLPLQLPLRSVPVPVIVAQDHAQIQEQLERKHEQLQQLIVRQQEELQQVKEQLLLARLGILQPVINAYANPEHQVSQAQPQISFQSAHPTAVLLPPQLHPSHPPPHPPSHPPGPHHHMPQ